MLQIKFTKNSGSYRSGKTYGFPKAAVADFFVSKLKVAEYAADELPVVDKFDDFSDLLDQPKNKPVVLNTEIKYLDKAVKRRGRPAGAGKKYQTRDMKAGE